MDVLGPLLEAPEKVKFVIVATKCIEAKPLAKTTRKEVKKFVWDNIVCRVRKHKLDGGNQDETRKRKKGWVNELPNVLWAHQTSLKTNNGETPYNLTFGSETVILAKSGMPTHRTTMIKEGANNEEEMWLNLDLLQERREPTAIHEARCKMKMEHYYNKRVQPVSF
nr:reverse transcriptase domain-containing protein [Tanacetum cinerariifolium]